MKINFDADWKFQEGDLPPVKSTDGWGGAKARAYSGGVPSEDFDDSKWRRVELPHDFVSEKEYCFQASDNAEMRHIPEMESIGSRLFAGGCLEGGVAWYRKKFWTDDSFCDRRVYIHFDGYTATAHCTVTSIMWEVMPAVMQGFIMISRIFILSRFPGIPDCM